MYACLHISPPPPPGRHCRAKAIVAQATTEPGKLVGIELSVRRQAFTRY